MNGETPPVDNKSGVFSASVPWEQELQSLQKRERQLRDECGHLRRLLDLHERDRQLIGYEIHDGVVQDVTAAVMFIEAATGEIDARGQTVPESLEQGLKLLREAINEARRLISGLQMPVLAEAGLVPALDALIAELQERTPTQLRMQAGEIGRFALPLELGLYRIVQECLNNVLLHSQASQAVVDLQADAEHVTVQVRDDGVGFNPDVVRKKRYGLSGIDERARMFGGQATVVSSPGSGCTITVTVPRCVK